MARREAACALLPAPRVEWGAEGPCVRVVLVECPACGARPDARRWTPPFTGAGSADATVLRVLACESIGTRGLLPIVAARPPGPGGAAFESRAVAWSRSARLGLRTALRALDESERWADGPVRPVEGTLPASTRHRPSGVDWADLRGRLAPSFVSPHPAVPASLERMYARELREAIVRGYAPVPGARGGGASPG
ncbi:hypothetical protein GCM10010182_44910 [Actinomadura cremea]|nr:hypothetical protein GCM10010182_44910 [Actinomadura cremea]